MARSPAETARAWRDHRSADSVSGVQVGVAGSFTVEPIEAHLGMGLVDLGPSGPTFRFADYNQLHQLCLDPTAVLGGPVDHIVAMWRIEDVFPSAVESFLAGQDESLTEIVRGTAELGSMFVTLAEGPAGVTVSTPPLPVPWGSDIFDSRVSVRLNRLHLRVLDAWLDAIDRSSRLSVLDLDGLTRMYGLESCLDETKWALYRQPFTSGFWALLGRSVAEVIARESQPAPKCIVLDCDNTLWGGVVGEDGLSGIALGDNFPGSAFSMFQRRVRQLKEAGVMLAVASKNDESAVRDVFERHSAMVLSSDDIACWRVNWNPKGANLVEIADELNIGTDSLVFVDDSPYEIAEVANAVPDVTVLQVPEETADLPGLLGRSGLFRHLRVSDEDRQRTRMMLAEGSRKVQQESMSSEEFLASLELQLRYFVPGDDHVARVAQLTNKTNQFNLTTIRRSEAEIGALLESESHELRAIRVSDRFGDYGVVGVAVVEREIDTWAIESFLMSCRVLGRGVESAFLASIVEDATQAGASRLEGRYVPTPKNGQVSDFYERHGFSGGDGSYVVDLAAAMAAPDHIAVAR